MATTTGYYLYGFTDCGEFVELPEKPMADGGPVRNIPFQGVGILCSSINGKKLHPTRDNLVAHQKVVDTWVGKYTLLPSRFGSIAESKGALHHGIRSSLPIIRTRLRELKGKYELNLKAFWERGFIYDQIVEKYPDIRKLRDRINRMRGPQVHHQAIELGQWVEQSIVEEGEKEAAAIIKEVTKPVLDYKKSRVFGELMLLNLSLLVNNQSEPELDRLVNRAAGNRQGRVKFRYVGPTAPAAFVDIHLRF